MLLFGFPTMRRSEAMPKKPYDIWLSFPIWRLNFES